MHRCNNRFSRLALVLILGMIGAMVSSCKPKKKAKGATKKEAKTTKGVESSKTPKTAAQKKKQSIHPTKLGIVSSPAPSAIPPQAPLTGPEALNMVIRVDLDKLRKTFLWAGLMKLNPVTKIIAHPVYKQVVKRCRINPLTDPVHLSAAIPFGPGPTKKRTFETFAFILKGRFKSKDLMKCFKTLLTAKKVPHTPGFVANKPALVARVPGGPKGWIVMLDKNTVALASEDVKEYLIGPQSIFAKAMKHPAGVAADPTSTIWVAWSRLPPLVKRSFSQTPFLGRITLKSAATSAEPIKNIYRLRLAFLLGSAAEAQGAVQTAAMIQQTFLSGSIRLPPKARVFASILKSAKLTHKGPVLMISLAPSKKRAMEILVAPFRRYLRRAKRARAMTP